METTQISSRAEIVRHFNRFYTRQLGLLQEKLLKSPYSLIEARIIYELAHRRRTTAGELAEEMGLDTGYLSRNLAGFYKRGLIEKQVSDLDARQQYLWLTPSGWAAFTELNESSQLQIEAMLAKLSPDQQDNLTKAMRTIEGLLGAAPDQRVPYILRPPQPGDIGWVIQRHGALYAQEYGWDEHFEALVAEIAAKFIQEYDPKKERCWIAEKDGDNVGSVFLVKQSDTVGKLRLLLVEPGARGLGIGTRLVEECIRYARRVGYQKITLWTNSVLLSARHVYEKTGFKLIAEESHHSFGQDLIGETWELVL